MEKMICIIACPDFTAGKRYPALNSGNGIIITCDDAGDEHTITAGFFEQYFEEC